MPQGGFIQCDLSYACSLDVHDRIVQYKCSYNTRDLCPITQLCVTSQLLCKSDFVADPSQITLLKQPIVIYKFNLTISTNALYLL